MASTERDVSLVPYLPGVAVDWILDDPERTWRELDGSLVFVDVSGFTALSERLAKRGRVGAEELTDIIGTCFAEMLAAAYRLSGSLLKFGGDALLLLFTGPEHQLRATRSAVHMRQALRSLGRIETSAGSVGLRAIHRRPQRPGAALSRRRLRTASSCSPGPPRAASSRWRAQPAPARSS